LAYHQLLTELSRYEFDLQSGAVVENTCGRELKQYAKMESEVEHAISDTQNDIEALKKTLQQERIRRQQKEEYETISRIINTHRPRDALQKEIAALEAKLNLLNSDAEDASKKVEVRQKQLHLFLSSMQELSSLWAEESNAHEGTQKGGGAISMSRLPSPSNDEMDEDDEEDEDDIERCWYRGAVVEDVTVAGVVGVAGETGETGETGATGEDGNGMDVEEHEEGEEGEEGDVVMGEAQAEDGEILE
jgi:chromosome segregation ATPase